MALLLEILFLSFNEEPEHQLGNSSAVKRVHKITKCSSTKMLLRHCIKKETLGTLWTESTGRKRK